MTTNKSCISSINMRSPRFSRKRSRSPLRFSRPSRSPSPPSRASKKDLQSIRITVANVRRSEEEYSILHSRIAEPKFSGPELDLPRPKDQKKIQIEIRRSISSHKVSHSPVRRSLRDPRTVFVARSSGEGSAPIFDRDEIKRFIPQVPEQRVVAIIPDKFKFRHRSRSPLNSRQRPSVHERLGEKSVHERLGDKLPDSIMNRDELESRRPMVKPWDVNPEFVPKSRYYFEHDNREDFQPSLRTPGFHHRGRFNSNRPFRGRGGRGGFYNNNKRSRNLSPEWKHDKYHELDREDDTQEAGY